MAGLKKIATEAGVDSELVMRFNVALCAAVARGERVIIRGLGTFERTLTPEREFNTALMSEPVIKPARFKVSFKPSEKLLASLPTPDDSNESP